MPEQSISFKDYNISPFSSQEDYDEKISVLQKLIFAGFPDYVNYKLHEYEDQGLCTPESYLLYIQSCLIVNAQAYAAKHTIDFLEKCGWKEEIGKILIKLEQKGHFISEAVKFFIEKKYESYIRNHSVYSERIEKEFSEKDPQLSGDQKIFELLNQWKDDKYIDRRESIIYEIKRYFKEEKYFESKKWKIILTKHELIDSEFELIRFRDSKQFISNEEVMLPLDNFEHEYPLLIIFELNTIYVNAQVLLERIKISEEDRAYIFLLREYVFHQKYIRKGRFQDLLLPFYNKIELICLQWKEAKLIQDIKDAEIIKEELKNETENLKKERDKIKDEKKWIQDYVDNSFNVLLKRRTELEYALSKSAIDELWLDKKEFYQEITKKVEQIKEGKKMIENNIDPCNINKWFWISTKIWFRNFFLKNYRREQLNYVLPTLRASYLGEWKEFLIDAGRIITGQKEPEKNIDESRGAEANSYKYAFNIEHVERTSDKIGWMVNRFDEILKNDQERNLREKVFKWLIFFLFIETAIIFWFAYTVADKPHMETLLSILIPATIAQITIMIYHIVQSLFPKEEIKKDSIVTTQRANTEKPISEKLVM